MPAPQPLLTVRKILRVLLLALSGAGLGPTWGKAETAYSLRKGQRLLFVGDILLSRNVLEERKSRGLSPWRGFDSLFHSAAWVMGNLEGAVGGPKECRNAAAGPCFAVPESLLVDLRTAGFTALGLANNHAQDLGPEGELRSRRALLKLGLLPMTFRGSPFFVPLAGKVVAFVSLSLVPGKDGNSQAIGSLELKQKLRLARQFAAGTVVFIHWGNELQDWPSAPQVEAARWLVRQGADLVVGMHPHVIQPPQCVDGKPVFYSLGNHLFDQKYPATKRGLVADCLLQGEGFACRSLDTEVSPGGFHPRLTSGPEARGPAVCPDPVPSDTAPRPLTLVTRWRGDSVAHRWEWRPRGRLLWKGRPAAPLSADRAWFPNEPGREFLFNLERHYSPLDRETAPRPYVYEITETGLVARWRGSGLAWPLRDAVFRAQDSVLCALHRGDSFLVPDSAAATDRIAAYRWNGFGFSMAKDSALAGKCRETWE